MDADIQHYFQVILEQDHVEEGDIQRLLDAYREKFEVDFVYVGGYVKLKNTCLKGVAL